MFQCFKSFNVSKFQGFKIMGKKYLTVFLCFLCFLVFGTKRAEGQTDIFTIKSNNPDPVQFCKDSVLVAEKLTIEGIPAVQGIKISITEGYIAGEDELTYKGKLNQSRPFPGTLVLTGGATVQDYVDAFQSIKYTNYKNTPTRGVKKITVSLANFENDADYLPATGHFYRFVRSSGIWWTAAEAQAKSDAMKYYGLRGYLATITSQVENDFIRLKTTAVGWIGASDAGVEGDWRWVTGPEGLEDGGKGRLFWIGPGSARNNPGNGPYQGRYSNWNTNNLEPNNQNDEDYAHITLFTIDKNRASQSYTWNDLSESGGQGDYLPEGYLIEFGGMPGDPVLNLTATVDLQVNTVEFDPLRRFTICEGDATTLNGKGLSASYLWTPSEHLSSSAILNPIASPVSTTTFIASGTNGICRDTAHFKVLVNPAPVSQLKAEENICIGDKITLDPGPAFSYKWANNASTQTITVDKGGDYSVILTSDNNCKATYSSKVVIHDFPSIDTINLQRLICGAKNTLVNISTNGGAYSLLSADGKAGVSDLNVTVSDFGVYPMIYKASLYPSCPVTRSFDLSFQGIPKVGFSIDSTTCYHYNLDAIYKGDADPAIANFTWIFGGDTIVSGIGYIQEKIPLGVNQPKRDLILKVEQNGCSDEHTIRNIRVIPTLSLAVKDSIRCQNDLFEFSASNTETGVSYDWDFGDRNKGSGRAVTHQYNLSGKYDIQLMVTTDKLCSNTVMMKDMVYAAPIPTVGFDLDPEKCLDQKANRVLYAGTGDQKDTYNWDLSAFDPVEIIGNPGTTQGPFTFNLLKKPKAPIGLQVVSKYGCISPLGRIVAKRKPSFDFGATGNKGCVLLETAFLSLPGDPVDRISYSWNFGDGTTGAGNGTSHLYNQKDQRYNITLTGFSEMTGCSDTIRKDTLVFVYPKPIAGFTLDHSIVYNDKPEVRFDNKSQGATHYLWDFGDGSTSEETNPFNKFKGNGYKKVLLEAINDHQCSDTISQEVLVAFNRIYAPNAFSPNAPNAVDREFKLSQEAIKAEGYHLVIISRWNDIVFETKNEIKGWDGRMKNGEQAPAGGYVWVLDFTDFLGRTHKQTGTVAVVY